MSKPIYRHVRTITDIREINKEIRKEIRQAKSEERLNELVRRSAYLCTLTHSPNWTSKFKRKINKARRVAKEEYEITARMANRRLQQLGKQAKYDVIWGEGRAVVV